MATLWAWRVHLGFVRTSPAGGESGQEISSITPPAPPPAPASPAPAAGENDDRPADEPPTPPAGVLRVPKLATVILRPVRGPRRARWLLQAADGK